jgi:hypothetical protein
METDFNRRTHEQIAFDRHKAEIDELLSWAQSQCGSRDAQSVLATLFRSASNPELVFRRIHEVIVPYAQSAYSASDDHPEVCEGGAHQMLQVYMDEQIPDGEPTFQDENPRGESHWSEDPGIDASEVALGGPETP